MKSRQEFFLAGAEYAYKSRQEKKRKKNTDIPMQGASTIFVHFLLKFSTNFHKNVPPAKTMRVRENRKIYFRFAK